MVIDGGWALEERRRYLLPANRRQPSIRAASQTGRRPPLDPNGGRRENSPDNMK